MPDVMVQIDSLVVHGMREFDAEQFSAALNHELASLTGAGELRGALRVEAVTLEGASGLDSAALGQQVAQAIHARWTGDGG